MVLNFRLARLSPVVKIAKINRNFLQNTTKCRSIIGSTTYNLTSGDSNKENVTVSSLRYLMDISWDFKPHGNRFSILVHPQGL